MVGWGTREIRVILMRITRDRWGCEYPRREVMIMCMTPTGKEREATL